jgi:hypothetical protein
MKTINEEECVSMLPYLYLDHIRRTDNEDASWGFSICLLEFAYNLIVNSGHGCQLADGCVCEICVSRSEITEHGKGFLEAGG